MPDSNPRPGSSVEWAMRMRTPGLVVALWLGGAVAASGALALPPMTADDWRQDLQFAADSFVTRDRSFDREERARFLGALAEMRDSAGVWNDDRMVVRLAEAVALAHNAHTRLYLVRNRSELRRYPLRVWWFEDGLYVVRATPEHASLLGGRLIGIGRRPIEEICRAVRPLYAGNDSWAKYLATYLVTCPDLLAGLGIGDTSGVAAVRVEIRGRSREEVIRPLPLHRQQQPTEAWWDLSPLHPGRDGPWRSALPEERRRLPLYLRYPQSTYWAQYEPGDRLLYVQFNRAGNAPEGETFDEFGRRILSEIDSLPVRKVVVDLRFNTGGNLDIARSFMEQLGPRVRERGAMIYVAMGRTTFSAGITHAAQLRQFGNAVLVGEPVGDDLDMWSEGGNLVLPRSRLTLHYADRFHSYSTVPHPELKEWLAYDLEVEDLHPDIPVGLSSREYFAGRDPVMNAIRAHHPRRAPARARAR